MALLELGLVILIVWVVIDLVQMLRTPAKFL